MEQIGETLQNPQSRFSPHFLSPCSSQSPRSSGVIARFFFFQSTIKNTFCDPKNLFCAPVFLFCTADFPFCGFKNLRNRLLFNDLPILYLSQTPKNNPMTPEDPTTTPVPAPSVPSEPTTPGSTPSPLNAGQLVEQATERRVAPHRPREHPHPPRVPTPRQPRVHRLIE